MSNGKNDSPRRRQPSQRDYEDDGVYYTPSGERQRSGNGQKSTSGARRSSPPPRRSSTANNQKKPSNNPKKGSLNVKYAYFYIATLVVAVIVCLVVFFMAFNYFTKGSKSSNATTPPTGVEQQGTKPGKETPLVAVKEVSIVGMINNIETQNRKIEIFDIENFKSYNYDIGSATGLKNKYGEVMSLSEFKKGDIVDARFQEDSQTLSSLNISSMAWEQKQVTNAKINVENATITIGNETYKYDRVNTKVLYGNENYDISKIDPLNVFTLRGMKDMCWLIEIEKAVGTIEIINSEHIKNGIIEIDTNNRIPMEEDGKVEPIKVQEGIRRYVVKGSNIEPFTGEIEVKSGETKTLDLSAAVVTAGEIKIEVNVTEATITIDNKEVRLNEPIILPYGKYKLSAKKDGYEPYEDEIEISNPNKQYSVTLIEMVKMREIRITTIPTGADVYIDNVYIGISPISTQVEDDARTLVVKKEGYAVSTIYMMEGESAYEVELIPQFVNTPQTDPNQSLVPTPSETPPIIAP